MREIKFRAWSPSKKLWREDWVMDSYEKIIDLNKERYDDDLILCQYTGLKDNTKWEDLTEKERADWTRRGNLPSAWNGKEIYEGDVLGVKLQKRNKNFNFTHVVKWEDDIEVYGGNHWSGYGYELPNFYVKVIGNIYENPELLEKK